MRGMGEAARRRWAVAVTVCALLALAAMLAAPEGARADVTLRMTFTGDVTLGCEEKYRDDEDSLPGVQRALGDAAFFANVKALFDADDLTVVNLEGVLSDSAEGERTDKTYRFRGPGAYASILQAGGIEMANLANNHTLDYGERGYRDTLAALDAAGIAHFGGEETASFTKDGVTVAFLGMSYTEESRDERERMAGEIARLKAEGASAVVFVYHGGQEYGEGRTQRQQDVARMAVDAGADLVVMHHPHVVQGMSVLSGRSVCYSLGNFCFGGNKRVRALESLIVVAEMTFSDDGVYLGQRLTLYPANVSGNEKKNDYQPRLVDGAAARRVMRRVQADTRFALAPYDEALGCAPQEYLPAE